MGVALGTLTFIRPGGRTLSLEVEIQDAVGDLATFDSGAGAADGSDYFTHGEQLNLVGLSMLDVTTATALRFVVDGIATRQKIHHNVDYLHSMVNKPLLNISIPAKSRLQIIGE